MRQRIQPGLYVDERDALHFDVPELLEHWGYADTPENREVVSDTIKAVVAEAWPGVPLHEISSGAPPI